MGDNNRMFKSISVCCDDFQFDRISGISGALVVVKKERQEKKKGKRDAKRNGLARWNEGVGVVPRWPQLAGSDQTRTKDVELDQARSCTRQFTDGFFTTGQLVHFGGRRVERTIE